jgi:hypothetical protein
MLRDDYLLRMIEQVGRMLARVRELLLRGEVVPELEVRQAAAVAGIDLGMARAVTAESLPALVSPGGRPDATRCLVMAEVLFADALLARFSEDSAGEADRLAKVEALLAWADQDDDPTRRKMVADRVSELREMMRPTKSKMPR